MWVVPGWAPDPVSPPGYEHPNTMQLMADHCRHMDLTRNTDNWLITIRDLTVEWSADCSIETRGQWLLLQNSQAITTDIEVYSLQNCILDMRAN